MHQAFRTYKLNETGVQKAAKMAEAFDRFLTYLDKEFFDGAETSFRTDDHIISPATRSREHSLLVTKLEEASFIAKKGLSIQDRFQAPQS